MAGELVREASGSEIEGASAVRFVVPLDGVAPGVYDLTIDSGARALRTVIGVVPRADL